MGSPRTFVHRDDFVTLEEARYLALVAQCIEPHPVNARPKKPAKSTLRDIVEQTSVVQLDSISVVSRAHETALWSRVGHYRIDDLNALHFPDGALFEYWAHAASLLPIAFFPFVRRTMLAHRNQETSDWGKWATGNRPLLDEVLRTVTELGPVSTRAFERPAGIERKPWSWFGGKPAKQALDCLWTMGDLVVQRRVGFERFYDLAERAFPELVSAPLPAPEEEAGFFTRRALTALGIGPLPWIADYFRRGTTRYVSVAEMRPRLDDLTRDGVAYAVALEGMSQPVWLDASLIPVLEAYRAGTVRPTARTLLCPFDNLLWRRDRALALFGFDYRLESYTPEPKRIYGYYTLPILIGGQLIGRLDARYRRKERLLSVQSIHLEPAIRPTTSVASAILGILRAFTRFLGGDDIEVVTTVPEKLHQHIRKQLA